MSCPFCAEPIAEDAEKCPHCGEHLRADRERTRPATSSALKIVAAIAAVMVLGLCALGALGSYAVVRARGAAMSRMKQARARAHVSMYDAALAMYRIDMGSYPAALSDLWTPPASGTWNGPYVHTPPVATAPLDPWGNAYVYTQAGAQGYTLTSHGADGAPGGTGDAADIVTQRP